MKKLYILFLLAFLTIGGFDCYSQHHNWSFSIGGSSNDQGFDITTDLSGNTIIAGYFIGTMDFDPSGGTKNLSSNSGSRDIFVAKYDRNKFMLWAFSIGGEYTDYPGDITTDNDGNVYITGHFGGTADFDPSAGTYNRTSNSGSDDIFIAKYDPDGAFLWVKTIGSSLDDAGSNILVNNGSLYISGLFQGTNVDFDPGVGINYLNSTDLEDIFITKFNTNGTFVWAYSIGNTGTDSSGGLKGDGLGNIIIAGYISNTTNFNVKGGTYNVTGSGDPDIFMAKYSSNADISWAISFNGTGFGAVSDIDVDEEGGVYITGNFYLSMDMDPTGGERILSTPTDTDYNAYLAKYDNSGNHVWSHSIGGSSNQDAGKAVKVMSNKRILWAGNFQENVDFDFSSGVNQLSSTTFNYADCFIGQYDSNGNLVIVKSYGGPSIDRIGDIAIDNEFNIMITGDYWTDTDLDPDAGTANYTPNGASDVYLLKLSNPLIGTYLVGPNGHYPTIQDPIGEMEFLGIQGPVTINIEPGNYNEQLSIPLISGTDATNTITFQSQNGDSTSVTISSSGDALNNYVLSVDGASWINFQGITFENTNPDYGTVIEILPVSDEVRFLNCVFSSPSTIDDLVIRDDFNLGYDSYTRFERNLFSGGNTGLYINETNMLPIIRNVFENQASSAIDLYEIPRPVIVANTITGTASSYTDAIYMERCLYEDGITAGYLIVRRNRISIPGNGFNSGIALANIVNDNTVNYGLISNNFIHINGLADNLEGISLEAVQYCNIYHNSINITGSISASAGIYLADNNFIDIKNNIISNIANGLVLSLAGSNTNTTSDYNDLYTSGGDLGNFYGTNCGNLSIWQSTSGLDVNSFNFDPLYQSDSELYTYNESLNAGTPLSGIVPDDIDYRPRDPVTPTIGAYEINLTENDSLALVAFYNSLGGSGWTNDANWLAGSMDTWFGITVTDGRVTHIDLADNNLTGTLPDEIYSLSNLELLNINTNNIDGTIASSVGNLTQLQTFDIGDNNFSGKIPTGILTLNSLMIFAVGNNNFADTIPSFSNSIVELYLYNNQFTAISDLTGNSNLSILHIHNNALDFGDLETYSTISDFIYSPQDSLGIVRTDSVDLYASFSITIEAGGSNTSYQWYKDGNIIDGATSSTYSDSQCINEDYGEYYCSSTNTNLPDLILYSQPVNIVNSGSIGDVTVTDYQINQDGSGDFLNFNEAVSYLVNNGIHGIVNVNIANGIYNEQVNIPPISGSSEINVINFQSISGDSTKVVLTWSADATNNYTLNIQNGTEYFTFRQLTIRAENSSFGHALLNDGSHNQFIGNHFIGVVNDQEEVNIAVIYGSVFDSTHFINNRVENGSRGISFGWGSNGQNKSNVVMDNLFLNQSGKPISLVYQDGCLIDANKIYTDVSGGGIDLRNSNYCRIKNNIIRGDLTDNEVGGFGIMMIDGDGRDDAGVFPDGYLANNFIYYYASYQTEGIYVTNLTDYGIYYNTVHILGPVGYGSCFTLDGTCSGVEILNNIFSNDANSYTYYFKTNTGFTSNYNDIHSTDNQQASYTYKYALYEDVNNSQTLFNNLTEWQNFSGNDLNSISIKPTFENDVNYKILNKEMDNAGTPVSLVMTDIEGETRDESNPDIGADEYESLDDPDLITINSYASPSMIGLGIQASVHCEIKNQGNGNLRGINTDLKVYLSSNTVLETDQDSLLITYPFDSLDAGATIIMDESFTFGTEYTVGDYNLIFITDHDDRVLEGIEDNNTAVYAISLSELNIAELEISNIQITPQPVNGYQNFTVSFNIDNYGNINMSETTSCEIFLSEDKVLDGSGYEQNLTFFSTDIINAYSNQTVEAELSIPDGLTAGTYYLILIIDPDEIIEEANEYNNIKVFAINIIFEDTIEPVITIIDNIEHFNAGQTSVSCRIKAWDNIQINKAWFWHRGILADDSNWQIQEMIKINEDTFSIDISNAFLDLMGMEYAFSAEDIAGNADTTSVGYIYNAFSDGSLFSQSLNKGNQQNDYRIISIPLQLNDMSLSGIFEDEFGTYDPSKWRVFRLNGSEYSEMTSGTMTPGEGYWLINNIAQSFSVGAGSTPHYNRLNPFKLTLNGGWNMIGNPYPFQISWNAVLNFNGIDGEIGNLKFYNGSGYVEKDILNPFEGAFVSTTQTTTIEFPLIPSGSGNRVAQSLEKEDFTTDIDEQKWLMKLKLNTESMKNEFGGIGMHPEASSGIDQFDDFSMPPFMQYLDMNHKTDLFFGCPITRNVVASSDQYSWEFEVNTNLLDENIILSWENKAIKDSESSLVLIDISNKFRIDMNKNTNYSFPSSPVTEFKIIYLREPLGLLSEEALKPYPNPFTSEIYIPVITSQHLQGSNLLMSVYNINGRMVREQKLVSDDAGFVEFSWDGTGETGCQMPPGVYFIKLAIQDNQTESGKRIFKVIKR